MKTTALSNDRLGFLEAYRHAVDVARTQGEADPENKVVEAFKSRAPLESIFARKPSDADMSKLYAAMDDSGKRAVLDATTLFDMYAEMIAPSPPAKRLSQNTLGNVDRPLSPEQLRRRAAAGALGWIN